MSVETAEEDMTDDTMAEYLETDCKFSDQDLVLLCSFSGVRYWDMDQHRIFFHSIL